MPTKRCTKCGEDKPIERFCRRKLSIDGLQAWCKDCAYTASREWMAANPERVERQGVRNKERVNLRYATDTEFRESVKKRATLWRKKQPPELITAMNRRCRLKREYGMTQEEYQALYDKLGGHCEICGGFREQLVIDHDHRPGRDGAVRGLLCTACNSALGKLGDTEEGLRRAIDYLRKHERPRRRAIDSPRKHERPEPLAFIA